ncbi:Predicted DNA-binding transcriptional regulator YafY, contains an HTH and WYL domains [Evansella caseinilytica]|uniref:Predicted DNA-binding transcriptional regulator YafY, contains an HTH and WYL domains n=1 Tax=Evansella caseinilytica TaxID=1503961 RepID=A0A1H3GFC7_9BACI|nr:YafY family protein [Evansella caseinilytica]SDY02062.1 Predicted DNA-binding transcriptional regulator YafY, contains an HTH and WYL domains [Evansella caseinilytica]
MKADRLLEVISLLQNHGKVSTNQIAGYLNVSNRTVLRDMDTLSALGIPIVAERGRAGGWRLMEHFRSELSGMSLTELKSLFVLPSEKVFEDLGLATKGVDIRLNLLSGMQGNRKTGVAPYLEKIYIDTGTWKPSRQKIKSFETVQQAVFEEKKLRMTYKNASGLQSERLVFPLGLVAKGSTWYLIAASEQWEIRNFRLSRINKAEIVHEPFTRPAHFSLAAYWKQSKEQFVQSLPSFPATVLAHQSMINRLTFTGKFIDNLQIIKEGEEWVQVKLSFHDEQEIVEYVLGFGDRMKLLEPVHLIDQVVKQARAVLQQYVDKNKGGKA